MKPIDRRELPYWLALAFHLPKASTRNRNALVLRAAHQADLSLLELVALDTDQLPAPLEPQAPLHERLLEAEGRASAQAFIVDRLVQANFALLPVTHADYPRRLLERLTPAKAPTLLSVAGNSSLLREPGVAVSGSRKASPAGLSFARAAGRALAEAGFTVVSGLARGVDSEALEGALEAGGRVIGISAEGIFQTRATRRPEVQDGRLTIVSEFEPNARWAGWAAMKRNSTIAGMSRALIIADCVAEGGTTAQFDVHRDLGLPVHIRRGPGEGRLMAELAARPGAHPLPWVSGPVILPRELGGVGIPAQQGLRCSTRREAGRWHLVIDAPESSTPTQILNAVRAELAQRGVTAGELAPGYAVKARSAPVVEPAPAPEPPQPEVDPILGAIATMPGDPVSVKEIGAHVGWSATKIRGRLRSLEEAGMITADRSGRTHVFSLPAREQAEPKEARVLAQRSQLELLSG